MTILNRVSTSNIYFVSSGLCLISVIITILYNTQRINETRKLLQLTNSIISISPVRQSLIIGMKLIATDTIESTCTSSIDTRLRTIISLIRSSYIYII